MSDFSVQEEQDIFTTKLSKMVDAGHLDQAINTIIGLENPRQQLITLQVLAHKAGNETLQLRFDIAMATLLARPPSYDLARDIPRAIDLALETATKRDMIRTRNIDLTRALVHAVTVARGLDATRLRNARVLARTLDTAYNVSHEIDPDIAAEMLILNRIVQVLVSLYTDDWAPTIMRDQMNEDYLQKLADALDETLYLQQHNPSNSFNTISIVLQTLIATNLRHVTLERVNSVSPDVLGTTIAPYLQALNDFLKIHAQLIEGEFQPVRVVQMAKGSCKLELTGIGNAIHAFVGLFQLEKRQQPRQVDMLETAEAEQTVASIHDLEPRKQKKSGEVIRHYLERAHMYIENCAPELSFDERLPLVIELADALKRMGTTGIALRLGWHDEQRSRYPSR